MPAVWLTGAQRAWITSTSAEKSDGGIVSPVARLDRALLQFTFSVFLDDIDDVENLFVQVDGPANGFFCKPPLTRDHKVTGGALGTATGAAQNVQLTITRGKIWNALYPIEATIIIYANGVALSEAVWSLGALGVVTVTATAGQTLTATFEYRTPFRFVEDSLETNIQAPDIETVQSVTIEEIP